MSAAEEWRPVPGWPDYSVSNLGRVVSHKRREDRELVGGLVNGYRRVIVTAPGERKYVAVHRLVVLAFVGPVPDGLEVRHLDGDPLNNDLSNLAVGTHAENMQDRLAHGRHPMANKTHCLRGHEFTDSNIYRQNGGRSCRTCKNHRQREYLIRKQFAAANVQLTDVAA